MSPETLEILEAFLRLLLKLDPNLAPEIVVADIKAFLDNWLAQDWASENPEQPGP